jgi:hypothetical protein
MANKKKYRVTTPMPPLPELLGGTELSLFDQTNNDINLFNLVDDEIIRLGGSELLYYKFRMGDEDYDQTYLEARSKVLDSKPMLVYGHYNPTLLEETLSEFGLEIENEQIFIFNKSYIEQKLHEEPKAGDVIKPRFQNQKYEIYEVQEDSFEIYGVYHMACSAKLLRDTEAVLDEDLDERTDDLGGYLNLEN